MCKGNAYTCMQSLYMYIHRYINIHYFLCRGGKIRYAYFFNKITNQIKNLNLEYKKYYSAKY